MRYFWISRHTQSMIAYMILTCWEFAKWYITDYIISPALYIPDIIDHFKMYEQCGIALSFESSQQL